jgi:O-antigen/teichoic acid export membrane protein
MLNLFEHLVYLNRQVSQIVKNKLGRELSLTLIANLLTTVLASIGGIFAARYLGINGRGELAAAIVWADVLGLLAQVGMAQALTYFTARQPTAVGDIFRTTLVIWFVQSLAIVVAGTLIIRFVFTHFQPEALDSVLVFLFSVPLIMLTAYLITISQGLKRFDMFNIIRVAGAARVLVCIFIASVLRVPSAAQVVIILLVCQFVITVGSLLYFVTQVRLKGRLRLHLARQLLSYGSKSYLGNLSWMANSNIDQFIMSAFVSLDELGLYSVAVSYSKILFPFAGALANVLFPSVAESSRESSHIRIKESLKLNLVVTGAGVVLFAVLSPLLIPLLFGREFIAAIPMAVVLLISVVFLGSNYVLSDSLRGLGHPLFPSIAEFIGMIVTAIGLAVLLPVYQGMGAAVVSLLSYSLITALLFIALQQRFKPEAVTSN